MCRKGDVTEVSIDGVAVEVDRCMVAIVLSINRLKGWKTLGCCCGHRKYRQTVVCTFDKFNDGKPFEVFTKTPLPRSRKFYKMDDEGYYYIPEVELTDKVVQ